MTEKYLIGIRVGDRLPVVGDHFTDGAKVTDVRYAKQGAIGFEIDDPETIARIEKALADYAEAVRRDQYGPWTIEEIEEMERRREAERRGRNLVFDSSI